MAGGANSNYLSQLYALNPNTGKWNALQIDNTGALIVKSSGGGGGIPSTLSDAQDNQLSYIDETGNQIQRLAVELYGWNDTSSSYDRLRVDNAFNLKVAASAAPSRGAVTQTLISAAGIALNANASRNYLLIQNTSSANNLLVGLGLNVVASPGPAIILAPGTNGAGASLLLTGNFVFNGVVYVAGTAPSAVVVEG